MLEDQIPLVGGRLVGFAENWKKITSDQWVLKVVQEGLHLQFTSRPARSGVRETVFNSLQKNICILKEITELLEKRAIELVPKSQEGLGFYSTFFLVPKKDGGLRPILNLRNLNVHLSVPHFKMETFRKIKQALKTGDWVITLDLKDAYFHVPIFHHHRQYLRFCFQGRHYQFKVIPFGLAVAPRVFTKVMAVIGQYLRTHQIHIFMYLDDWLIKSQNCQMLVQQRGFILDLLHNLGLVVNWQKSRLTPTQDLDY
jgi:hypothetical protein